jgi:hypothetical protein
VVEAGAVSADEVVLLSTVVALVSVLVVIADDELSTGASVLELDVVPDVVSTAVVSVVDGVLVEAVSVITGSVVVEVSVLDGVVEAVESVVVEVLVLSGVEVDVALES